MFIFPPPSPRFLRENRTWASNSSLLQEAWQLRLIYAGISPQCQEMLGWLSSITRKTIEQGLKIYLDLILLSCSWNGGSGAFHKKSSLAATGAQRGVVHFCAKPVPGEEMDSPRRGQIFTPGFQDLLGWLFKIPVRMVATSCLVPAAKFFDRLSNLLGLQGFGGDHFAPPVLG